MFGLFGKPSRSKFATIVIAAARKAGVQGEITFQESEFSLRHANGVLFLGNLYDHYCAADRAQKAQLLENYVSILLKSHEELTRDDALDHCVAAIRERAMFESLALRQQGTTDALATVPTEPIGDWYVRTVVIDAPGFMRMVNDKDLKEWDISYEELAEVGLQRLQASSPPKFKPEGAFYKGTWNDDYDSSRILLPDLFQDLPIDGDPVFCIPNRLNLLVADSANLGAVAAMLAAAETIVQSEPRPQCPNPLTIRDGEVVDFIVKEDSPIHAAVQRARGISALIYYQDQQALLEDLHQRTGKDLHVAAFSLMERKSGGYVSYSVWSKGVTSLLPKTDLVMFFDPDRPKPNQIVGAVAWRDVEKALGDLLLDTEMFPPRYFVSRFPSVDQIAALPKVAD